MNKERIKGIVVGFLLCAVLSTSVMVMATPRTETRQITYGVRVNFNGQLVQFNADNQPFVMGGRTFLPMRAMADLLGLPVDFDPSTNTAYVGNRFAGQRQPLHHAAPFFDRSRGDSWIRFADTVTMGGVTYNNAFILGWPNTQGGFDRTQFSLHNLGGQYRVLSGYMGRIDGTSMHNVSISIIGDGVLLESFELRATDMPIPFSVFVEGVQQMRIEIQRPDGTGVTPRYAIVGYLE